MRRETCASSRTASSASALPRGRASASSQDSDRRRSAAPIVAGEIGRYPRSRARTPHRRGRRRRATGAETDRPDRTRHKRRAGAGGRAPQCTAPQNRSPPAPASENPRGHEDRGPGGRRGRRDGSRSAVSRATHSTIHAACASRSRFLAHALEGVSDVEVVDADQLAPAGVEKHELAERAELQRAPNRERIAGPPFATPRILPKSRE